MIVSRVYRDKLNRTNVELVPTLSWLVARTLRFPHKARYMVDVRHSRRGRERRENYRSTYWVGEEEFPYGVVHIGSLRLWIWSLPLHPIVATSEVASAASSAGPPR